MLFIIKMESSSSAKIRGTMGQAGIGSNAWNRQLLRSDNNMFDILAKQDGAEDNVVSYYSDSDDNSDDMMEFTEVQSRKGKRQRMSSSGRSGNQDEQVGQTNVDFDMLSADEKLSALFNKLSQVERKVDCVAPLTKRVVNVENVISSHEQRLQLLEYKSIDIESRSRRRNLIFRGMSEKPEEAKEGSIPIIRHFIYVHLGIQEDMYIERAHRLGRYKQGACRPIVVAFRDYQDTDTIMSNCRKLKGTFFSVNRDYPAEIVEARKALYPMYKEFRDQNRYNKVSIQYPGKLIVNGVVKHDMFPNWSEIMSGYRVDSRQLFVNTEVCQQRLSQKSSDGQIKSQPIKSHQPVPNAARDSPPLRGNHSCKERSNDETFGAEKTTPSKLTVSTRVAEIHSSMERACTKRPVDKGNTHSTLNAKTNSTSFVNTGSDASGQQSTSKGTDGKGSASDHGPGDPASGQNQTK